MKSDPKNFSSALTFSNMAERGLILEAMGDHMFSEESFEEVAMAYCNTCSLRKQL
jgi:hypothetical protein